MKLTLDRPRARLAVIMKDANDDATFVVEATTRGSFHGRLFGVHMANAQMMMEYAIRYPEEAKAILFLMAKRQPGAVDEALDANVADLHDLWFDGDIVEMDSTQFGVPRDMMNLFE